MKNRILLVFTTLIVQGCGQSSNDVTELEGVWDSACVPAFVFEQKIYENTKMVFISSKVNISHNNYSDPDCTILTNTGSNIVVETRDSQFELGNYISASNGAVVREIDFLVTKNIMQDIYLLQDDEKLYFGLSKSSCEIIDQSTTIVCYTGPRPTEIDYSEFYTKQK